MKMSCLVTNFCFALRVDRLNILIKFSRFGLCRCREYCQKFFKILLYLCDINEKQVIEVDIKEIIIINFFLVLGTFS